MLRFQSCLEMVGEKLHYFCVSSVENNVVLAAKRLHSLYITKYIVSLPSNVEDTSKLKLEDVVRLLYEYCLDDEKRRDNWSFVDKHLYITFYLMMWLIIGLEGVATLCFMMLLKVKFFH